MNTTEFKGIIELGNINLRCIICKINDDDTSTILSSSITRSDGIHNGVVINLKAASNAIRSCISTAEERGKVSLKKINVVLEQPEFLCTKLSKHRKINGSKIYKEDIEFLLKEAKKQVILNDEKQTIVHIFNHNYIVDGKTFIEEPIDVYADKLSHEITFVTMPKNYIKNINQAFIDCDIEIERFISSIFSLGANLLNNNELKFGSIIIDIGHEKTSVGIFKNFALVHSATIPIGNNHAIKDISKVCSLSIKESKVIISDIDFSFKNYEKLFDKELHLKQIYFSSSNYRKISKSLILNVIKARIEEIFEKIKKQIFIIGPDSIIDSRIFITGGGSNLINLEEYCTKLFKSKVVKLIKQESEFNENFASCLGAFKIIKDGWETEAIPKKDDNLSQKKNFFSKIFGN